ncbi:sucrose-6-phosphate hydrolase [Clostridium beijerinckii]|uniref:Sucrose-6-phosphate hydrolase n=1 Tax=Clostridium beijerinckii TaxID=1520 RepID=A0A0B5QUP1_CLOBE|nr:sucrose-6-phosphate hydrolase [Clostridium beijerinckii]AJH01952.1 sucrose-6-phosphate hydrolase [Clostridium beijerinckii]
MNYLKNYEKVYKELEEYYNNNDNNIWRNKFHIEMPFGLINDPNGLSFYNGEYHIFYQWNPFGCEHKTKHWGLVKTKDFVNFTKPQIILKPEEWYDKNGCYSGGAYVKNGTLKLFYTGNVKDINNQRESYQCMVDYNADGSFEKKGVLIDKQPERYTAHFRDPMIFEENETYYMVLGVQTEELKGKALIYKSKDINNWRLAGELKTNMNNFGYMWECPNVFRLNEDKFAFMFSPQGLEEEEFKYQNIYQSGYVIGNLNLDEVSLTNHTKFKEIDMGFDFYAPQVFHHNGKNIMIGWIGMPDKDNEYLSSEYGWMFGLTMPRVLEYKDNVLYQKPLELLKKIRQAKIVDIRNEMSDNWTISLDSRNIECKLDLNLISNENIGLKLSFKDEYILISYSKKDQVCTVDRNNMKLGGKGIRKFKLKADSSLRLHMFIDNSIIEIYYQDGLETTTLMYFPKSDNFKIEIGNDIKINELQIWEVRRINYGK